MGRNNNTICSDIENVIKEVGEIGGSIPEDQDLYNELGVKSIHAVGILIALEEKFDIKIEDEKFVEARTLEKLELLVKEAKGHV